MGLAEVTSWSIDSIQCSSWKNTNDVANVEISNVAMDSISFQVVRTPDGDIVPFNTSSNFRSTDWYIWTTESDAIDSYVGLCETYSPCPWEFIQASRSEVLYRYLVPMRARGTPAS